MPPRFAILLVSYNSRGLLERCLERIEAQEGARLGAELELLVIDNASSDGSRKLLELRAAPYLHAQERNLGFAGALNLGLRRSSAPWVLSLNPDVLLAPDFFAALAARLDELQPDPALGMIAPKLRRIGLEQFQAGRTEGARTLDSTGLFLDRMRRPYDRGQGAEDRGQFDAEPEVLGPCGAAGLYRRSMLQALAVGGEAFDERLFAYYEDVDLAWRARRAGWSARYVPEAAGWHVRAASDLVRSRPRERRLRAVAARAHANRLLVLVKNERLRDLAADLPGLLGYELARQAYVLLTQPRLFFEALGHLARGLWPTLRKRRRARPGLDLSPWIRRPR
jgi:GT2 family glycosyltransferase